MASLIEWKVPQSVQPRAEDYSYDLERTLSSVVGLHSIVPPDAFTADTLGVERAGNGVLIDDGLVLTIGYLITEAETVWLHLGDGRVVQGHALGFDQETGFGLVQALGKIDLPPLEIGSSSSGRHRRTYRRRRRRWPHALACRAHRCQAGICRLLGIRARRSDLYLPGASQLGRHGADLQRRQTDRHRFAAARARARRQERTSQHGRADRSACAGARRSAQVRPRQSTRAAVARALLDRDRGQDCRGRHRPQRTGRARRDQDRRRRGGCQGRARFDACRRSTERFGRWAMPAWRCRSRSIAKA